MGKRRQRSESSLILGLISLFTLLLLSGLKPAVSVDCSELRINHYVSPASMSLNEGVTVDIRNPTGSKSLIFLGGGFLSLHGIVVQVLPDYDAFISSAVESGYRVISVGATMLNLTGWTRLISHYSHLAYVCDRSQVRLVGHSAGALIGTMYLGQGRDSAIKDAVLFNDPLIYPMAQAPFNCGYKAMPAIQNRVLIVMSSQDFLMQLIDGNNVCGDGSMFSMQNALDLAQTNTEITVKVLTVNGYTHSPFDVGDLAWRIFTEP